MTDHPTPERAVLGHRIVATTDAAVAFADLTCADAELLHGEFDAIIAANFPAGSGQRTRLPPRRPRPAVADRPRRPVRRTPVTTAANLASSAPRGGGRAYLSRQRSPPRADQATEPSAMC